MLPVTQLLASPSMHWASMAHPCGWGFGASTDVVTSQLVGSRYAVLLRPSLTGLLQVESLTASGQPPARSLRPIAVEASSMSGLEEGEREAEARVNSAIEKGAEARVRNPIDFACGQTNELQSRNLAGSAGLPTDDPVPASPMDPTNSSLRRSQRNVRKTARFSTPIGGVRNGASAMAIRPVQKAQPAHRSQRRAGKKPRRRRRLAMLCRPTSTRRSRSHACVESTSELGYVASMAWGARNSISTQVRAALREEPDRAEFTQAH